MIKKPEGKALNHRTFIKRSILNIKKSSVGEPLAKFRLLSMVAPPLLDCLRMPGAANWIRLV